MRLSAYVFDDWGGGSDPAEVLTARAEAQGRRALALVKGPLLLFVSAGPGDPNEFTIFDLSSAYSRPS